MGETKNAHPGVAGMRVDVWHSKYDSQAVVLGTVLSSPPHLGARLGHSDRTLQCSRSLMRRHDDVATLVLADKHFCSRESFLEHVDTTTKLGIAPQEHVQRGKAGIGMRMDGDMPAIENGESGYTTTWSAEIHVDMEQVFTHHLHTTLQGLFDMLGVVQPDRAKQIYYEMTAGNAEAIPFRKSHDIRVTLGHLVDSPRNLRGITMIFLLGGA